MVSNSLRQTRSYTQTLKDMVSQQKRRLKEVLGDLKVDSDAPPAVRRLASAHDDDNCDYNDNNSNDNVSDNDTVMVEKEEVEFGEMEIPTTAPPTPRGQSISTRQDTQNVEPKKGIQRFICQTFCGSDGGNNSSNSNNNNNNRQKLSLRADGSKIGIDWFHRGVHDMNGDSFVEGSVMFPNIPRVRSSYSSSKISGCHSSAAKSRGGGGFLGSANATCWPRRSNSFSCQWAPKSMGPARYRDDKDNNKEKDESRSDCSNNSNTTTGVEGPNSVIFIHPLGLLEPAFFSASFPRTGKGNKLKQFTEEEQLPFTENTDEVNNHNNNNNNNKDSNHNNNKNNDHNEEPSVKCEGVDAPAMQDHPNRVKLLQIDGAQHHQRVKTRGSESCFSLSTPRRQSTCSSMHYSATMQLSRQALAWSPRAHNSQPPPPFHSRVYSLSRASSERGGGGGGHHGGSPTGSSTLRQWHPEPQEWGPQPPPPPFYFTGPHTSLLPAFGPTNAPGEAMALGNCGESFLSSLQPRHTARVGNNTNANTTNNNSVSSVLLARTSSNVDTLPTCCDAPLDTFMESSTLTMSSTITALTL